MWYKRPLAVFRAPTLDGRRSDLFVVDRTDHRPVGNAQGPAPRAVRTEKALLRRGGQGILGRQAPVFAAAETAGRLIEEILELRDLNPDGVVNRIFARVCDEAESDGPRNALVEILGWADANDDYFSHRLLDGSLAPARPGEKLGHKDPHSVAIYPAKLKEMLRRFGYDIKTTLTAWRDRNWIKLTENDKFTYVVRTPNGRTRMIKIMNLDPMNDGTLKDEELW